MKRENYKNAVTFYGFILKKNKLKMVIAFFLSVLKICITLLLPILSMRILDSAIPSHNFREIVFMAIGILSFTLCQSVISYILETIYAKIGKAIYLEYQKKSVDTLYQSIR